MTSPLWTAARQELARRECARWAGTPHFNRLAVPGQGVDCIHFVKAILAAAGIIPDFRLPWYDERLGALRTSNILETLLVEHLHAEARPPDAGQFGDVVICKAGRQTNHVGILIDGKMWHVPGRGRVGGDSWSQWRERTQSLVTITAEGYRMTPAGLTWPEIHARL